MRFYTYGYRSHPTILLIPGTCCHHSLFDHVIPLLTNHFFVAVASFTGFDEYDDAVYQDMGSETMAMERYIQTKLDGHIACCYGCSLGGSFAAYLVQRGRVKIDHAILGSSDMDEAGEFSARLQAGLMSRLMYGPIRQGKLPGWLAWRNARQIRRHPEEGTYRAKFTASFFSPALTGGIVARESIFNQVYSDLVTRIDNDIFRKDVTVHVFYAEKMGKKYAERYLRHFRDPDIRRHPLMHEELLFCYPDQWAGEVFACCGIEAGESAQRGENG